MRTCGATSFCLRNAGRTPDVTAMSVPDWLSATRLILVGLLSPFALAGEERVVGMGLVAAGLTDALAGFVARRLGVASRRGAVLDAVADMVLMFSAAEWRGTMHPRLPS